MKQPNRPGRDIPRTPLRTVHQAIDWAVEHLSWAPAGVNGLVTLGAAVCFALVGLSGDTNLWFLGGGILLTLLSLALTAAIDQWRRANKRGEQAEAAQLRIVIQDAIAPLLDDVARMPALPSTGRKRMLLQVVGNVSTSVKLLLPEARRLRVIVYRVKSSAGKEELVVVNSIGRKDTPRVFTRGDGGRGDTAFKMLEEEGSLFVADTTESHHPIGVRSRSGYRTFISTSIVADDQAFGMLSVDAPSPGDLDENDVALLDVIARILAVAFAEEARK